MDKFSSTEIKSLCNSFDHERVELHVLYKTGKSPHTWKPVELV